MHICVYCSASPAALEPYSAVAREVGQAIARRGHTLVFGGCAAGLMGALAEAASNCKGRIIGVIPRAFRQGDLAYESADEILVVETLAERKAKMLELAQACLVLPGGFGTLDELCNVLALKQVGAWQGPIVLLNAEGFFEDLLAHFARLYTQNMAKPDCGALYSVAASPTAALECVEASHAVKHPRKRL